MNKFKNNVFYYGNLMKYNNGSYELHKRDVLLIYDESKDLFYSYMDTFNSFLSIDLFNMSKEEIDNNYKIIDKNKYNYVPSYTNDDVYVDENSIVVAFDNKTR